MQPSARALFSTARSTVQRAHGVRRFGQQKVRLVRYCGERPKTLGSRIVWESDLIHPLANTRGIGRLGCAEAEPDSGMWQSTRRLTAYSAAPRMQRGTTSIHPHIPDLAGFHYCSLPTRAMSQLKPGRHKVEHGRCWSDHQPV